MKPTPLVLALFGLLACRAGSAAAATTPTTTTTTKTTVTTAPKPVVPLKPAPLAEIADADGDVDVVRKNGTTVDGEEDVTLFEGDTVKTAAGASAAISFVDHHILKLGERTTLVIRTVKSDPRTGSFLGQVGLLAGKLFASFGSLTGASSGFKIDTRTAVAAVKGTTFSVEADDEASTVAVLEGTVATAGVDAQGREAESLDVPEGQETSVGRGERKPRALRAFLRDQRRAEIRERLAQVREHAREHRDLRASGGLDKLRELRRLARDGRLDAAGPDLKAYLDQHPAIKARVTRHAERHRRVHERRRQRLERREDRREERREKRR